ncbi:MAG: TrkH family potassium uptake protein [Bacteroidetes bacterium]|nr:TrkH family potassium uptake protein [Bacteroidota bacterium]
MKLINRLLILRILSTILLIETVSVLLCIPVALIYNEPFEPFLWSAVFSFLFSAVFRFVTNDADYKKFSNRDGYLIVTLSWLVFLAFGTLPYILTGTIPSFIDAFFESSSGFTTTGSTIITDVEVLPYSILFWRSLTHWLGGFGFIVLVIIILPSIRVTGYQLFSLESTLKEKIHPKTKSIGYRILLIYLTLTIAEILLLNLGEMDFFESLCYSFGTIATGGFSTKNSGIIAYSAYSQYIIMIFMLLAGISQVVYYYIVKFNFRKVSQNEELWFYLGSVIIAGALATSIILANSTFHLEKAFRDGFFNVISIITTTGFASTDYLLWPGPAVILIFLLMFTGGSTGSTTGNIKMARHLLVIKNIKSAFVKVNHPNALSGIKFNGKTIAEKINISILSFVVLYLFIFVAGTLIVVATGPDVVTAASAVAASLGNIGPGLGTVGPMSTYAHLPEITKLILSLLMILGRLEIISVFALFTRTFWKV